MPEGSRLGILSRDRGRCRHEVCVCKPVVDYFVECVVEVRTLKGSRLARARRRGFTAEVASPLPGPLSFHGRDLPVTLWRPPASGLTGMGGPSVLEKRPLLVPPPVGGIPP